MDLADHFTKRCNDLEDSILREQKGSTAEFNKLADAILELRKAINGLERVHGVSSPTQWKAQLGTDRPA